MGEHMIGRSRLWVTRGNPKEEPTFVISGDHLNEFILECDKLGLKYEVSPPNAHSHHMAVIGIKITDTTLNAYIAEHGSSYQVKCLQQDLLNAVKDDHVMGRLERLTTSIFR